MNVLVIAEDFIYDQYILRPIIEAMLVEAQKRKANVLVYPERLGGVVQALKWERIKQIINRYKHKYELFLLCIDRDGRPGRREALNALEKQAQEILPADKLFLSENAWQEIEVWVLAGHKDLPNDWNWKEIRLEANPKEIYFQPFAEQKGLSNTPDGGRKKLAVIAARNYLRIRALCEEVAALETRIP